MPSSTSAASRISQDDIAMLDQASTDLALAYSLIAQNKPKCAGDVLPLIYRANTALNRMTEKGLRCYVEFYRRHPPKQTFKISPLILAAIEAATLERARSEAPQGE